MSDEKPKRIQRKRTKGWRMPERTLYVGRGSRWGNPYKIGDRYRNPFDGGEMEITRENCLELFRLYAQGRMALGIKWLEPLRGKNLSCWCREDQPCHADILLELANQ